MAEVAAAGTSGAITTSPWSYGHSSAIVQKPFSSKSRQRGSFLAADVEDKAELASAAVVTSEAVLVVLLGGERDLE